jgi:hypothetical protein
MKPFLRTLSLLSLLLLAPSKVRATEPFYKENTAYQWITQKYRFTHHLDYRFDPGLGKSFGGSYRLAYSLGEYAVDLQFIYDRTSWGVISPAAPGTAWTGTATTDPASQYNVARSVSDPWTLMNLETGISYRGRLLPRTAFKWIQSGRMSLGYVRMKDGATGLSFAGPGINFEASIWYQVLPKLLIGPTFGYRFGWGYLMGQPNVETNRLPFLQFQATLGTVFRI